MKKTISLLVVFMILLSVWNANIAYSAKSQTIRELPLSGIIDIDDSSLSDHFYALQADGTIWIGFDGEPAIRGPRVEGAVKISGNLVLTSYGEVWTWSNNTINEPKRIPELSNIQDISSGPAYMALNDKGEVYVWGSACFVSLMRPDFQDRKKPLCYTDSPTTQADIDQANIPKVALENVKAIRGSLQSLMVLLNDGKTIYRYGNIYLMDMGMEKVVSDTSVTDFVGYDSDAVGYGDVRIFPDKRFVPELPMQQFHQFSVSYEGFYSLYLNQNGTVWGKSDGSLQQIQPLNNIIEVNAVALNSGTALDKNGTVWTWGNRLNMPYDGKPENVMTKIDAKPAKRQLSLKINEKYVESNPGPVQMNGVTFVPMRVLFESIGAKVDYANDQITVSYRNQVLKLKVYDTKAVFDGKNIPMPVAATSYQGKTYVPVRFIAETLGAKLQWDAADGCVVVQLA